MNNILENIAIALVSIFSVAIIALIIQYNLIGQEENEGLSHTSSAKKELTRQDSDRNYLKNLEQYNDVDVKVDPQKEVIRNKIKVKSELANDELGNVLKETRPNSVVEGIDNLLGN